MSDQVAALEIRDLVAGYGSLTVLRNVALSVRPGEVVTLLGANGAGKTTTLRAVSGFVKGSGVISFEGHSVLGMKPESVMRRGLAHVPEGRGTFPSLTVKENLRVGAFKARSGQVEADVQRWTDVFPVLGDRLQQPAGNLSGGEQQMLAIARAMMSRPKLLLLDEPSRGLAPSITQAVFEKLGEINRTEGTSMLIVEQNANLALALADRAFVLEAGEIVLSGPADELKADDRVRRAYLSA